MNASIPTFTKWDVIAADESGRPERLLEKAPLVVHGLSLHVEAWRVERARLFKPSADADDSATICGGCIVGDSDGFVDCTDDEAAFCRQCGSDAANTAQVHAFNDEDLQRLWRVFSNGDGDFQSTEIPGFDGQWIVLATPYVD